MAKLYAERDEGFLPVFLTLPSENIEEFNDEKKENNLRNKKHTRKRDN